MQYTVTSRGQPIGVTDLGFAHPGGPDRVGWFHPNAAGEPLMAVITAASVAAHAWMNAGDEHVGSTAETDHRRATLLADMAKASQHVEALDLKLQREDGSEIPTECVSIKDVDELITWADKRAERRNDEAWRYGDVGPDPLYDPMDDVFDEELDAFDEGEALFELPSDDDVIFGDGLADTIGPCTPSEYVPAPSMRYQIYVCMASRELVPDGPARLPI